MAFSCTVESRMSVTRSSRAMSFRCLKLGEIVAPKPPKFQIIQQFRKISGATKAAKGGIKVSNSRATHSAGQSRRQAAPVGQLGRRAAVQARAHRQRPASATRSRATKGSGRKFTKTAARTEPDSAGFSPAPSVFWAGAWRLERRSARSAHYDALLFRSKYRGQAGQLGARAAKTQVCAH